MQFQKISILLPQKGSEFPAGWGSVRPKNVKKCTELNWNFQRGGRGVLEKTLPWGGMDIFWKNIFFKVCFAGKYVQFF